MPQLLACVFIGMVVYQVFTKIIAPLFLYLVAVALVAAAGGATWLLCLLGARARQSGRGTGWRSCATHRVTLEDGGILRLKTRARVLIKPRNDGFAALASIGWLHHHSGWTGPPEGSSDRIPIHDWETGLKAAQRADEAFASMGVTGCFDLAAHIRTFVEKWETQVLVDPSLVGREFAAHRARVADLADLAERHAPRRHEVNETLRRTARAVFGSRSASCLACLDDLQATHRTAPGHLLRGDWHAFRRDMDDIEADALDLQAVVLADADGSDRAANAGPDDEVARAHALLGVPVGHPVDKMRDIARRLLQTYHPDKGPVAVDDRRFKEIQQALEISVSST